MSKTYDEIMDRITVTPEMKERILSNLKRAEFGERRRSWNRFLPAAACLLVLAIGALTLPDLMRTETQEPPVMVGNGIAEVSTAEELSISVGFSVHDLSVLPFEYTEKVYSAYWGEMAEITYRNSEEELCYRKSMGTEDNSGDYNAYDTETQITVRNIPITLKGNGGVYNLIIWTDGEYAYSLSVTKGISETEAARLVEENEW